MAKVEFWCDSGANIHSCRKAVFDTKDDLGFEDYEWEELSEDEKCKEAEQWAWDSGLDIGCREL